MDMKPKNILQRVLDFAFSELERRSRPHDAAPPEPGEAGHPPVSEGDVEVVEAAQVPAEKSPPPPAPSVHEVHGLEAVRSQVGAGLTLRWSLSADEIERARALLSGKSVLCLRVVSFTSARDDVLREVQDRPGVDVSGECELAEAPERAVVSVGLRAGERFVSIAHHVL